MIKKVYQRLSLSLFLLISLCAVSPSRTALGQTAAALPPLSQDLQLKLQVIEDKIETRRRELGIPGVSLVIVKDDRIIYMKGLGYRDLEKKLPVTPDTQFAIGSTSKAFTALSVLMSQDEKRLSIEDNPKKYLPYFKINDAETDSKITIRDLLSHSSGLNRTDLAWVTGRLNREEIIRVAGEAKPTARLHEKFQYQNVMFTAAGEIVAQVSKTPWEKFVAERIFKPLGMTNSNLSIPAMERARDFSYGYEHNSDTGETRRLPFRDFPAMSPAGAINSSARDMAQWLRFMLSGGIADGKRLVSEVAFAEMLKPQTKIGGKVSYGLGWFIREWNGIKAVDHGGNIDGFNASVALLPEKKLGFVILTNVSASTLPTEIAPVIWTNLIGAPQIQTAGAAPSVNAESEVGKYSFREAGFELDVKMRDGRLVLEVPGQPSMTLENAGGRRYRLTLDGSALDGYFLTFRETDAYIEQPQGNYALPRVKSGAPVKAGTSGAARELIGKYASEKNAARTVEVREAGGKISLVVEDQPPYEILEKEKDVFNMSPLPDDYKIKAKRDADGKLTGIAIVQPEGEFGFRRIENGSAGSAPVITVEELMPKVLGALGGESAWKKTTSRVVKYEVDLVHQGVRGSGTQYAKAPNLAAADLTFTAFGKQIATVFDYFNGAESGEEASFAPSVKHTGRKFEDARISADFYGLLNWRVNYQKAEIRGAAKVGGEDAYAVVFEPIKGSPDTIYFSRKTFLPLRLESVDFSPTSGVSVPYSETYSDYRAIDGIMIPFKTINSSTVNGDIVTILKEVKHNVAIDGKIFRLP